MSTRTNQAEVASGGGRHSTARRNVAGITEGSTTYLRILDELADSGITRAELSRAVGAAERTVQTWAAGTSKPTGIRAQRLLDVQMIVRLLSDAYTPEGIRIWLNSRNRNLNLQRPIDLLTAHEGIDAVLEEADRLAGGL
jgi:uncharacterized protein (DUF2384 family)